MENSKPTNISGYYNDYLKFDQSHLRTKVSLPTDGFNHSRTVDVRDRDNLIYDQCSLVQ